MMFAQIVHYNKHSISQSVQDLQTLHHSHDFHKAQATSIWTQKESLSETNAVQRLYMCDKTTHLNTASQFACQERNLSDLFEFTTNSY